RRSDNDGRRTRLNRPRSVGWSERARSETYWGRHHGGLLFGRRGHSLWYQGAGGSLAVPRWASRFTASSSRRNRRRRTDRASQGSFRFNRPVGGAALRPRRSRQHLNLQRSCGVVRRQRAALAERWTRRTERVRRTPQRAPRGNFVGVARTDTSFSNAPHPIGLLRSHGQCQLWVKSRHVRCGGSCLLWANSGHWGPSMCRFGYSALYSVCE